MIKYMVSEAERKLNVFPNKYGISKYFSPRMILHQENLDFKKALSFFLGRLRPSNQWSRSKEYDSSEDLGLSLSKTHS